MDTVNPERFRRLMRWGEVDEALAGVYAAEEAGLTPVKIDHPWHVRFIESMPLGIQANEAIRGYVPNSEVQARIEAEHGSLEMLNAGELVGEARMYRLPNAAGQVGFINPVSEPYCDDCNRLRLTADGKIRLCLLTDHELDFRTTLREEGMEALKPLFVRAVTAKPVGHQLRRGIYPAQRGMSQIGG